jgi:hypothetical protein
MRTATKLEDAACRGNGRVKSRSQKNLWKLFGAVGEQMFEGIAKVTMTFREGIIVYF